jgi:16S rRNA (adenine1518-N6/adenine1519-N6)-dimethyltransferase
MVERLTSPRVIKEKLAGKNLAPRKSLGQNFLIDKNIRQKIIEAANVNKTDVVVEIGPGLGVLTESLLERAGKVIGVEYDQGLSAILQETFGNQKDFILLNQDFLETDLSALLDVYPKEEYHYKVVANLPYYITTPVIFKLMEAGIHWDLMVFMVQKEVADRICAGPGRKDYGAMTVMLNFYGKVEKIASVSKTVFYPVPQVDSAIIRISSQHDSPATPLYASDDPRARAQIYPYLRLVVKAAFGQRRKTILNALASLEEYFGGKSELCKVLGRLGIDPVQRGETLSLRAFLGIAEEILRVDFKSDRLSGPVHQGN